MSAQRHDHNQNDLTAGYTKLILGFVRLAKGIMMAKRPVEPLKLLLRHGDPGQLLTFFRAISEGFTAAFADAATRMPAGPKDRPAVNARGAIRRVLMDRATRDAAAKAGLAVTTSFNNPPTWSFPVIRLGAFSVTLGIVEKVRAVGPHRLRNRGKYVRDHAQRNEAVNPQESLFRDTAHDVPRVIPNGSLGALVVAEASVHMPDMPLWIGFWVPSPNLRRTYYQCSLDELLATLREHQLAATRRARPASGRSVERKKPVLKPSKKKERRED